jgi:hypothetical protein
MRRNYLKGVSGDKINAVLAAATYNMMNPTSIRRLNKGLDFFTCEFDQTNKIKIKFLLPGIKNTVKVGMDIQ